MPIYNWKGINSYGEKRKGKIEAVDEAGARAQLKRMRIDVKACKEAPKDLFENIWKRYAPVRVLWKKYG